MYNISMAWASGAPPLLDSPSEVPSVQLLSCFKAKLNQGGEVLDSAEVLLEKHRSFEEDILAQVILFNLSLSLTRLDDVRRNIARIVHKNRRSCCNT